MLIPKSLDNKAVLKSEETLKKIIWKDIFFTFNDLDKSEFLNQIEGLEKDWLLENTIKIRVKPWFIALIRKLTGAHDIKWWAYRWTTVYVSDKEDLFNEELLIHEIIHVKQQSELSKLKFIWFIKWLILEWKAALKYKKDHTSASVSENVLIRQQSYVSIPTELEAYAYSDQKDYIQNRDKEWYKEYETQGGVQNIMKILEERNYKNIEKDLLSNSKIRDLDRLNELMDKTKNSERVLYVTNDVDEVVYLNSLRKLFEKKIELLESGDCFSEGYRRLRDKHHREALKFNLHIFLEDDFNDIGLLKKELEKINLNIKKYKRAPAKFWLEDINNKNKAIELWF